MLVFTGRRGNNHNGRVAPEIPARQSMVVLEKLPVVVREVWQDNLEQEMKVRRGQGAASGSAGLTAASAGGLA